MIMIILICCTFATITILAILWEVNRFHRMMDDLRKSEDSIRNTIEETDKFLKLIDSRVTRNSDPWRLNPDKPGEWMSTEQPHVLVFENPDGTLSQVNLDGSHTGPFIIDATGRLTAVLPKT